MLQFEVSLLTMHKIDDGCADYTMKSKALSRQVKAARALQYCGEGFCKVGSSLWIDGYSVLVLFAKASAGVRHGVFIRLIGEKVNNI